MLSLYVKVRAAVEALRDERGQDVIEYALLGALIAVAAAAVLPALGTKVAGVFTDLTSKI